MMAVWLRREGRTARPYHGSPHMPCPKLGAAWHGRRTGVPRWAVPPVSLAHGAARPPPEEAISDWSGNQIRRPGRVLGVTRVHVQPPSDRGMVTPGLCGTTCAHDMHSCTLCARASSCTHTTRVMLCYVRACHAATCAWRAGLCRLRRRSGCAFWPPRALSRVCVPSAAPCLLRRVRLLGSTGAWQVPPPRGAPPAARSPCGRRRADGGAKRRPGVAARLPSHAGAAVPRLSQEPRRRRQDRPSRRSYAHEVACARGWLANRVLLHHQPLGSPRRRGGRGGVRQLTPAQAGAADGPRYGGSSGVRGGR